MESLSRRGVGEAAAEGVGEAVTVREHACRCAKSRILQSPPMNNVRAAHRAPEQICEVEGQ
jgi:predicted amino acid racemase